MNKETILTKLHELQGFTQSATLLELLNVDPAIKNYVNQINNKILETIKIIESYDK